MSCNEGRHFGKQEGRYFRMKKQDGRLRFKRVAAVTALLLAVRVGTPAMVFANYQNMPMGGGATK